MKYELTFVYRTATSMPGIFENAEKTWRTVAGPRELSLFTEME